MSATRRQQTNDAGQPSLPHAEDSALVAVRHRATFLISALLWAAAGGAVLLLVGYLALAINVSLDAGERLRRILGVEVPATGPDWYLLTVFLLLVTVPSGLVVLGWLWYRRTWDRRLREVWPNRADWRAFSRSLPLRETPRAKDRQHRAAYLGTLLASDAWQAWWPPSARDRLALLPVSRGDNAPVGPVPDNDYRQAAEHVLRRIEEDVAERAIAVGLIVGLSPSRAMDRLTIVSAALELQLHVLSRLGKRPSLATWSEIVKRTGASLLVNTYLNREDTLALSLVIKKIGMGLEVAADLGDQAAESLEDLEIGESVDELLESSDGLVKVLGTILSTGVSTMAPLSLTVGATGIRQIAHVIEEVGGQLLEGVLASAILYYHGMGIAADTLALDAEHRRSAGMTRTPWQGATRTAVTAGRLLRGHVKQYRAAYRERHARLLRIGKRQLMGNKKPPKNVQEKPEDTPDSGQRKSFIPIWNRRGRGKGDQGTQPELRGNK